MGFIVKETLAMVHPNEAVVPLDRASEFGLSGNTERIEELLELQIKFMAANTPYGRLRKNG